MNRKNADCLTEWYLGFSSALLVKKTKRAKASPMININIHKWKPPFIDTKPPINAKNGNYVGHQ